MLAVRQDSLGHIQYILKSDLRWIPWYELYLNDKGNLERVEKGIRQIRSNGFTCLICYISWRYSI